jgi:hypothetical protein
LDEIEPATSPPFVRMGTRALGGRAWLLDGPDVPAQLAEKRRVLAAHHDVVVALDGTELPAAELLDLVHHDLATRPPDAPPPDRRDRDAQPQPPLPPEPAPRTRAGSAAPTRSDATEVRVERGPNPARVDASPRAAPGRLHPPAAGPAPVPPVGPGPNESIAGGLHPIDAAARLVAEDLCLLVPSNGGGGWVLGAASVCFPSHWRVTEKLGLPLAAVHAPVPDYAAELAHRVDRFLGRMRAGRGVVRRNWTVHTEPDLYAPDLPAPPDPPIAPGEAGQRLWLRSERQTLIRLPRTGAIVFTIRTQQVRLAAVATHPDLRTRLARAVAAWPPHQVAYRGGESTRGPLLAWLRSAAD